MIEPLQRVQADRAEVNQRDNIAQLEGERATIMPTNHDVAFPRTKGYRDVKTGRRG